MNKGFDDYLAGYLDYCGNEIGSLFKEVISNEKYSEDFLNFFASINLRDNGAGLVECFDMARYFAIYGGLHEIDDVHCALRNAADFYCRALKCYRASDPDGAWRNISESRFHMGIVYCGIYIKKISVPYSDPVVTKIINGKRSSAGLDSLREIFCDLLNERRPHGGWKGQTAAVNELLPTVMERYFALGSDVTCRKDEASVKKTLSNWLKQNADVIAVYNNFS